MGRLGCVQRGGGLDEQLGLRGWGTAPCRKVSGGEVRPSGPWGFGKGWE